MISNRTTLLFLFCSFFLICFTLKVPSSCERLPTNQKYQRGYLGWPLRILCHSFLDLDYEFKEDFLSLEEDGDYEEAFIKCVILNETEGVVYEEDIDVKNLLYSNIGYVTEELQTDSPLNYTIVIENQSGNRCVAFNFMIMLTKPDSKNCSDMIRTNHNFRSIAAGKPFVVPCIDELNHYPKLNQMPGVTYKWFYNCSQSLPRGSFQVDKMHTLRNVSLKHFKSGLYTCTAIYRDRMHVVSAVNICVKQGLRPSNIILECAESKIQSDLGRTVKQTCTANFGKGIIQGNRVIIKLKKMNEDENIIHCSEKLFGHRHVQCTFETRNTKCYNDLRSDHNLSDAIIKIHITINDVSAKDYTNYLLEVKLKGAKLFNAKKVFLIALNPVPLFLSQASVAGICIGITLLFLIMLVVLLYNSLYVRVYYKRYFGDVVPDDKQYGAYLAYNFSHHSMDKFTKDLVQDWIPRIRSSIEKLGYRVYDEHKDDWMSSGRMDNVWRAIELSHRVVILLTEDFVKDEWSILTLHKGFHQTIRSQSKLIFILLPGVKEYLKQYSKSDDSWRLVQRAIKLNYAIQLPQKLGSRIFEFSLEDAMPKLPRHKSPRVLSLSSQYETSTPTYCDVDFQHCFSSDTNAPMLETAASSYFSCSYDERKAIL